MYWLVLWLYDMRSSIDLEDDIEYRLSDEVFLRTRIFREVLSFIVCFPFQSMLRV